MASQRAHELLKMIVEPVRALALSWWGRKPYDRTRHAAAPTVVVDMDWLSERPVAVPARS